MTYTHDNKTFSQYLSESENMWWRHMIRWGSDGYPIRKMGGKWWVDSAFGVSGCPKPFRTRREAIAQCELQERLLTDRAAGRL